MFRDEFSKSSSKLNRLNQQAGLAPIINLDLNQIFIKKLTSLTSLKIEEKQLISSNLAQLTKLKSLTCLDLSGCKTISDKAMEQIAKLTSLTSLDLSKCFYYDDTTDNEETVNTWSGDDDIPIYRSHVSTYIDENRQSLPHITKLTALRSLSLTGCNHISDQGLEQIFHLYSLTYLDLSGCRQINNQKLEQIAKLTSLKSLYLIECYQITFKAIEQLRNKLPNCTIINEDTLVD